jgi:hypothetical protein
MCDTYRSYTVNMTRKKITVAPLFKSINVLSLTIDAVLSILNYYSNNVISQYGVVIMFFSDYEYQNKKTDLTHII